MTSQLNLLGLPSGMAPLTNARLAPAQKTILRLAMRPEGVTTAEAGRVVHAQRNGGRGCRPGRAGAAGVARGRQPGDEPCCPWMASDGWDALKRLRARGLVAQREPRGSYYAGTA